MPEITIDNLSSKTIHCEDKTEKLLDILLRHTDWMHACGGKGRCTTCTAKVLEGMQHLSERTEAEIRFANLKRLRVDERLMCQCRLSGNVRIKVPDLYKLPHLDYSE